MVKNYLIIALRNIRRNKTYTVINILGLTIGMACFMLIALYIQYELSFDKYHKHADQIYRIGLKQPGNYFMGQDVFNSTPAPLAPLLKSEYPEVIKASRVRKILPSALIQYEQKAFEENRLFFVDPDFIDIFSFPLVSGNPKTALIVPYSIILTEEEANKYFGNASPIGQKIQINQSDEFTVTGVMKNIPQNSHFTFDFLASFSTLYSQKSVKDNWNNNSYQTYILLDKKTSQQVFESKLVEVFKKYKGKDSNDIIIAEPLSGIHLHGDWNFEIEKNGDIRYIYLFGAIGIFLLMIACFNYINISTAQSVKRSKEVGLRKVVGASRKQILLQFLSEALIFSFISFCLSIVAVELLIPLLKLIISANIQLELISNTKLLLILFGIMLLAGCLAGAYPAFFMSRLQPVKNLKGINKKGSGSILNMRNTLVVFQFVISVVLIVCTFTVFQQLHYIKNKNLGYRHDHIITLNLKDMRLQKQYESFMNELSSNHGVLKISASNFLPFDIKSQTSANWEGKKNDSVLPINEIRIDYSFLDLYNIQIEKGRNFLRDYSEDSRAYILNETAIKKIGWKEPIGKSIAIDKKLEDGGQIIGIIKDFNFYPLYNPIEPLAMQLIEQNSNKNKKGARFISIKISSANISETISFIEDKWKKFTQYPFNFQFVDSNLDEMYKSETRLGELFNIFALIAILINCMGLYGLASNAIERKVKEIGIRKVLGASVSQIVNMLSKEIFMIVIAASLIAFPIAYYFMNTWLQDFAYRINISWWIFVLSGGITLIIALATISFQAIKAATANPVKSLKYE
jgi:putative ABC transport system permease protein